MRLGIRITHSRPGHPQTQGKDERFHRTMKEELLQYSQFNTLEEVQESFDHWRNTYNNIRPHEGINMNCPQTRYLKSQRKYQEVLPEIIYEPDDILRKVHRNGIIEFSGKKYYVGEHFSGEYVGIREEEKSDCFGLYFSKTRILTIDLNK